MNRVAVCTGERRKTLNRAVATFILTLWVLKIALREDLYVRQLSLG